MTARRRADPGRVFEALADPTRRAVLQRLAQVGDATATELAVAFPISRQAVTKHLVALAEVGLVSGAREGRMHTYRFDPAPLEEAIGWMENVGSAWERRLDALARQVRPRAT